MISPISGRFPAPSGSLSSMLCSAKSAAPRYHATSARGACKACEGAGDAACEKLSADSGLWLRWGTIKPERGIDDEQNLQHARSSGARRASGSGASVNGQPRQHASYARDSACMCGSTGATPVSRGGGRGVRPACYEPESPERAHAVAHAGEMRSA